MAKEKKAKSKKGKGLKIAAITFLLVVAAVIGGGLGYMSHLNQLISRPNEKEFSKDNIIKNEEVEKPETFTTIAIFGVDARNHSLGEGNRSDSIILASINNKTKEVKLTSIYRDTLVNIPGKGYDKITHAYFFGGPELALSTINQNFDLNVEDYVTVNFAVAEDIIDELGGLEIDVQPAEVKWLNGYVTSLAKEGADTKVSLISGSGKQTLTGSQSVAYSRIRYTSGGDYKRAKRQRTVLNAALQKIQSSNLTTLDSIIQSAASQVYTNFTMTELLGYAKDFMSYQIGDSQGFPYHVADMKVLNTVAQPEHRTYVGISKMLAEDVKTLHYILYDEGSPSTVEASSDSEMNEDNGIANSKDGLAGVAGTTQSGEETTGESTTASPVPSESTTAAGGTTEADEAKRPYTPSTTVQNISAELLQWLNNYQ